MICIYLDDERYPPNDFHDHTWYYVNTSIQCIRALIDHATNVDTLSLDHDLGGDDTGYAVAVWLENMYHLDPNSPYLPKRIIVHYANPVGRARIEAAVKKINERSK